MFTSRFVRRTSAGVAVLAVAGLGLVGAAPAVAATNPSVWVSNVDDDTVSLIDPATNTVLTSITVGDEPRNLAANPTGTRVYVPNRFSDNVSVIDVATESIVDTITVGSEPYAVVVSPDGGTLYVANNGDSTVSVVNLSNNTSTLVSDAGACIDDPEWVIVNPVVAEAYIVSKNDDAICVFSTTTNSVTSVIPVGDSPRSAVVTPDGAFLYVANNGDGTVIKFDLSTLVPTTIVLGDDPRNIAISGDGAYVYVPGQDDVLYRVTVSNDVVDILSFPSAGCLYGVALIDSLASGYVTDECNDAVYAFSTADFTAIPTDVTDAAFTFDTPRAITAINVAAVVPAGPQLANSGVNVAATAGIGAMLVLAGVGAVFFLRRSSSAAR